jgi:hypothetical protein
LEAGETLIDGVKSTAEAGVKLSDGAETLVDRNMG